MEQRRLMAARVTATLLGDVLRIEGTEAADVISVREPLGSLSINNGAVAINVNGTSRTSLSVSSIARIKVFGLGGNDLLDLGRDLSTATTRPSELYGGLGNDVLRGGKGKDLLYGDDPWLSENAWNRQLPGDFDGDGRSDVANFNPSDGTWWVGTSTGTSFATALWADFETNSGWTSQVVGDFNGDGRDDVANFHPSDGTWWVARSNGTSFITSLWADFETNSGWTKQVVGDFNGDGRDDIANFHPSDGTWWVARSMGSFFNTTLWDDFDTNSGWTSQVVGDFNGDGRDDIANFHPVDGGWWVSRSMGSYFNTTLWTNFETKTGWTKQIVGDFNGDGRDDIANFHPNDGSWWIAQSTGSYFNTTSWDNFDTNSGWTSQVVGDFDKDGRDDVANFHPNDGSWWVSRSRGSYFSTTSWVDFGRVAGGTDALYGGEGDDWLEAGSPTEIAEGGAGTDWNAHRWAIDGTTMLDVDQTGAGTCVFLSTLAGAARTRDLSGRIRYLGGFNFQVDLFDPNVGRWVTQDVRFDGSIVLNSAGRRMDPDSRGSASGVDEFWTIVYQRAYLRRFEGINPLNGNAVAAFGGEPNGNRATRAILGGTAITSSTMSTRSLQNLVLGGLTVTVGLRTDTAAGHSYTVLGVYQDTAGRWRVRLFNPWHDDAIAGGVMPFDRDGTVGDGIITVSWADLQANLRRITTNA